MVPLERIPGNKRRLVVCRLNNEFFRFLFQSLSILLLLNGIDGIRYAISRRAPEGDTVIPIEVMERLLMSSAAA